jgi:hypothetical protein
LNIEDIEIPDRNHEKDEKHWDAAAYAQTDQECSDVLRILADSRAEGASHEECL